MTTKTLFRILLLLLVTVGGTSRLCAQPPSTPTENPAPTVNNNHNGESLVPEGSSITETRFFGEFVRMMLSLGFILALLLIGTWLFKKVLQTRLQQVNLTSSIKILEKRALNPKAAVYLLEVQDRKILIAETPTGIASLAVFPPPQEKTSFRDIYVEKQNITDKDDV